MSLEVVGIIASNLIALAALYLAVRAYRREHTLRAVEIGPLPEEIRLGTSDQGRQTVQVVNATGVPQIIRDLWVRILYFPTDVDDAQAERLVRLVILFTAGAKDLFARPEVQRWFVEQGTKSEAARKVLPRLAGLMLNVVVKFRTGKAEVHGASRFFAFLGAYLARNLEDATAVFSTSEARAVAQFILLRMNIFQGIAPEGALPVTNTLNLIVLPKGSSPVEIDLSRFRDACVNALQMIGGEFRFACLLEARVHGTDKRSESDLIEVLVTVPPFDWTPIAAQIREEFAKMKWPPDPTNPGA